MHSTHIARVASAPIVIAAQFTLVLLRVVEYSLTCPRFHLQTTIAHITPLLFSVDGPGCDSTAPTSASITRPTIVTLVIRWYVTMPITALDKSHVCTYCTHRFVFSLLRSVSPCPGPYHQSTAFHMTAITPLHSVHLMCSPYICCLGRLGVSPYCMTTICLIRTMLSFSKLSAAQRGGCPAILFPPARRAHSYPLAFR